MHMANRQTTGEQMAALLKRSGLSVRAAAQAAGYAHGSGIQRYIDAAFDSRLTPDVAKKFATAFAGRGSPPITAGEVFSLTGLAETIPSNAIPFRMEGASLDRMRDDIPVYGTALGAAEVIDGDAIEQTFLNTGEVIEYIKRPVILNGRTDVYGLYVVGSSMSPRFEEGEVIYVDPKRPPRNGDDVVVYLVDADGDGERAASVLVKRLMRSAVDFLELQQFEPRITFRIEQSRVTKKHRVIPWSELVS